MSLNIPPRVIFSIIGPNGAGKTTVFNCVTGTQRPRSGTIELIFDMIRRISDEGVAVLLVEQNAHKALAIANHEYVLETGRATLEGAAATRLAWADLVQRGAAHERSREGKRPGAYGCNRDQRSIQPLY